MLTVHLFLSSMAAHLYVYVFNSFQLLNACIYGGNAFKVIMHLIWYMSISNCTVLTKCTLWLDFTIIVYYRVLYISHFLFATSFTWTFYH